MKGRSASLDLLRAAAVLLVIGYHAPRAGREVWEPVRHVGAALRRGGWCGVDLFFVLSGFLIGGLLFREQQLRGKVAIGRFLVRRGFKIYPAFYVFLAVSIVGLLVTGATPRWPQILAEALFVQSYFPGLWGHTWSLAVEEHFYIALPLLLWGLGRRGSPERPFPGLRIVFVAAAAGCLVLRMAAAARAPFEHMTHYFPTHLRIDSLLFGVVLAQAYQLHHERFAGWARRYRVPLVLVGLALMTPPFLTRLGSTPLMYTVGFTSMWLGSGAVLCALVVHEPRRSLPIRALAYVGTYSYSIYLWHLPVRHVWRDILEPRLPELPYLVNVGAYVASSLVVGVVAGRLIEAPVLRIRDRFFPSRSGSVLLGAEATSSATTTIAR